MVAQMLREECVGWWLLLKEEVDFMRKGGCHHNRGFAGCGLFPCCSVREAYFDGKCAQFVMMTVLTSPPWTSLDFGES